MNQFPLRYRPTLGLLVFLALFLSGCAVTSTSLPPVIEASATQSNITITSETTLPTHIPTLAASPSLTPQPSVAIRPTSTHPPTATVTRTPSLTPTFDVASIVSRTPAPAAQCPAEKAGLTPTLKFDPDFNLVNQVLEYLNSGGTPRAVIAAVHQQYPRESIQYLAQETDVTGDGVSDLLFMNMFSDDGMFLHVYICNNGQYKAVGIPVDVFHFFSAAIVGIKDLNLDGVPEIITIGGDDSVRIVDVFEWDGKQFSLLNPDTVQYSYLKTTCSTIYGPSWVSLADSDSNGTQELVFEQTIPIANPYYDGLPWRKETWICGWNGQTFEVVHIELAPPEYRFQAVQDGDRATLIGEYAKALDLYQQAIFSDKLDWWSQDRFKLYTSGYFCACTPTPEPSPTPDPTEYPMLAAYARYRIMLLHVIQGHASDAQLVYDTLQTKFPVGQVGHVYAEMAAVFWIDYKSTQDLHQSCIKAIAYAIDHQDDILGYLGDGLFAKAEFGAQSLVYKPGDICPY